VLAYRPHARLQKGGYQRVVRDPGMRGGSASSPSCFNLDGENGKGEVKCSLEKDTRKSRSIALLFL
jgi:hypothetical protein